MGVIEMEKKIILNGKEFTEEEFQKEKKILEEQKGVTVLEVAPNEYKVRIQG
jgi:hypothetical protein